MRASIRIQLKEKMTRRVGSILKPHLRVIKGREQTSYPVGCAFCQFDVPCMDRNPVKKKYLEDYSASVYPGPS